MDRNIILEKVTGLARDVFENDDIILTDDTTAADIEEWDSLTHLSLISDIEDELGITFTMGEVTGCKNVGELLNAIANHLERP